MKRILACCGSLLLVCSAIVWAQQPSFLSSESPPPSNTTAFASSDSFGARSANINRELYAQKNPLEFHKLKIIRQAEIPAEEAGVLKKFDIKEGQYIEAGELIGSIGKEDAELAAKIGAAEYEAAKKTAENLISIQYAAKAFGVAKADLEASMEANKVAKGTVTKQQLRSQRLQTERSVMQAEMAQADVMVAKLTALARYNTYIRAKAAIKRRDIRSPLNGVVSEKFKHEGEWVQPGEPVLKVIQMDQLWVEGPINGKEHAWHRIRGKKVKIVVTLTGEQNGEATKRTFYGKVDFASPKINANEYIIRSQIQNVKENGQWILSPGLDASVEILEGDDAGGGGFENGNLNF